MKRYISIFAALAFVLLFAACSKEDPFPGPDGGDGKMGQVLKSSLTPALGNEEGFATFGRPGTRAEAPAADDFTVDFIKDGEETPYVSYIYSEMPEIVSLPVGVFRAVAHYGNNSAAAWEEPYFKGETKFNVVADKITEDVEPIVATLSNVRVSITFAPSLKANMSSDAKVTVKVGEVGSLDFTAADEGRSAYFAYVENSCSLTATFSGEVEGYPVVESKVYDTVAPGSHYSITFRLHDVGEDETGSADANITVDASVEIVDMNITLDGSEEDEILEDDLRPVEGNPNPPVDPTPDDPKDKPAPTISPASDGILLDTELAWASISECKFAVDSTAEGGVTALTVDVISDSLDMADINLTNHLDLVNPGSDAEVLSSLGFPVNVAGETHLDFDISTFIPLLKTMTGRNEFKVTVTDANGTTVKSLIIIV